MTHTRQRERLPLAVYFMLLGCAVFAFIVHNALHLNGWAIADWLINYSGGFVRRGLLGEGLLLAGRASGIAPAYLAAALQMACYATLLWLVWRGTRGLRWSWAWWALLLSPATLAFPVLTPTATLKKEYLLFVALAAFAAYARDRTRITARAVALVTLAALFLVLSHEVSLIYMLYLFAPVWLLERSFARCIRLLWLPALLLAAAGAAVATHPGNTAVSAAVCHSLHGQWPPGPLDNSLCSGAIRYLSMSSTDAVTERAAQMRTYHYAAVYLVSGTLAFLPVVLVAWALFRRRCSRELRVLGVMTACESAMSVYLFVVATDWGRWIQIHVVCLMLLLLLLEHRCPSPERGEPPTQPMPARRVLAAVTLVLYATAWTLPAVGIFPGRFGYVSMLTYLRGYSAEHPAPPNPR